MCDVCVICGFVFRQKRAYEVRLSRVGSEMCIRVRCRCVVSVVDFDCGGGVGFDFGGGVGFDFSGGVGFDFGGGVGFDFGGGVGILRFVACCMLSLIPF